VGQGAFNKENNTLYTSYSTMESNFDLGTRTQTREKRAMRSNDENAVESEGRGGGK
jgi:hypothetical protein